MTDPVSLGLILGKGLLGNAISDLYKTLKAGLDSPSIDIIEEILADLQIVEALVAEFGYKEPDHPQQISTTNDETLTIVLGGGIDCEPKTEQKTAINLVLEQIHKIIQSIHWEIKIIGMKKKYHNTLYLKSIRSDNIMPNINNLSRLRDNLLKKRDLLILLKKVK